MTEEEKQTVNQFIQMIVSDHDGTMRLSAYYLVGFVVACIVSMFVFG